MDKHDVKFAKLARDAGISAADATVLTIVARHSGRNNDPRMAELLQKLDGNAREVATVLVRGDRDTSDEVRSLAELFRVRRSAPGTDD
jgi:pyruvate-formate lyase-activating enzyme